MRVGLLALLLFSAASLSAQVVLESVTVEVVDVPVFVTRGDRPLANLGQEQFELYVNGVRQPIEYFEPVTARGAAPTLRERRLFLLMFDLAFSHPLSLPRAQRAAMRMIDDARPGDYFAVATYSNRRGVWFAAPYTRDREALARAIRSLDNPRSGDPLSIVMTDAERAREGGGGDPQGFGSEIAGESLRDIARMGRLRSSEDQIDGLAELSDRLTTIEGEKHVVLLSEGWDGRAHPSVLYASSRAVSPGPYSGGLDPTLFGDLTVMHRRFQAAGVFLHTLGVEGVSPSFLGNDSLHALASGTGGRFIHSRNDLGDALVELSTALDRGYRIGFRPLNARRGYNSIEVRVRGAGLGLRVDHRRGFSTEDASSTADDGLYLADVLLNDVPQGGTAAVLALRDGALTAQVPMRELAAQGQSAELLLYAFAADGSALMYHREVIRVTEEEAKTVAVAVPEGTQVAKALLRVNGSVGFSKVSR